MVHTCKETYERIVPALITSISQNIVLTKNIIKMIPKYKQYVGPFFISNILLEDLTKDYNLITAMRTNEGIVYILKRKNIVARLINKLFNK